MKVSEVIGKLQKLLDEHGDLETRINLGHGSVLVEEIEVIESKTLGEWIELNSEE